MVINMRQIENVKVRMKEMIWRVCYLKLFLYSKLLKENYFVLMGTPVHGNLGDQAIAVATYQFLNELDPHKKIVEIPAWMLRSISHVTSFDKIIKEKTILLHGGGYLGSLWIEEEKMARMIIANYKENRIILLPQTIFFENSEYGKTVMKESVTIYESHPNLWICTREEQSYLLGKGILQNAHVLLVPDMVLYMNQWNQTKDTKKNGILLCLRMDQERALDEEEWEYLLDVMISHEKASNILYTDTVVTHKISKKRRKKEVTRKIVEFAKSKLVITDRLHGMVFSAIANTPCIALGNCNYKIKGVFRWLCQNKHIVFLEDTKELEEQIKQMTSMKQIQYDNDSIRTNYIKLKNLIRGDGNE